MHTGRPKTFARRCSCAVVARTTASSPRARTALTSDASDASKRHSPSRESYLLSDLLSYNYLCPLTLRNCLFAFFFSCACTPSPRNDERLLLASENDRAATSKRERKGSFQLGERGTAARSLQRTSTDADACAPATPTTSHKGSRLVACDFTQENTVHARVEGQRACC